MSTHRHHEGSDANIDEGTEVLKHLAEEIEEERSHGVSSYAVPEDNPDYVEDEATVEGSSSDRPEDNDGPIVPIRPA